MVGIQAVNLEGSTQTVAGSALLATGAATSSKMLTVTSPWREPSADPVAMSGMTCSSIDSSVHR